MKRLRYGTLLVGCLGILALAVGCGGAGGTTPTVDTAPKSEATTTATTATKTDSKTTQSASKVASSPAAAPATSGSPVAKAAGSPLAATGSTANVQPSCANPQEVQGFLTCADVEKAKQEGAVVYYAPDVERHLVQYLSEFNELFPEIKTDKYLREQTGRLYAKLTSERQAGTYVADVLSLSDYSPAIDFVEKGGYETYVSPQATNYRPEFLSQPPGHFTWYNIVIAGIAVNSSQTPLAEAPKTWQDLLDPKWKGAINFKDSASGLQGVQWYMLRQLYGDDFWQKMAAQNPTALASTTQQYERLVNREDKVVGLAQYSTYLENKEKGAPLEFIVPPDGLAATPLMIGVVDRAPHPEAAKLFVDFMLSKQGQKVVTETSYGNSPREDVAPPPGGKPISEFNLLFPADWNEFIAAHEQYRQEWDAMTGLR